MSLRERGVPQSSSALGARSLPMREAHAHRFACLRLRLELCAVVGAALVLALTDRWQIGVARVDQVTGRRQMIDLDAGSAISGCGSAGDRPFRRAGLRHQPHEAAAAPERSRSSLPPRLAGSPAPTGLDLQGPREAGQRTEPRAYPAKRGRGRRRRSYRQLSRVQATGSTMASLHPRRQRQGDCSPSLQYACVTKRKKVGMYAG